MWGKIFTSLSFFMKMIYQPQLNNFLNIILFVFIYYFIIYLLFYTGFDVFCTWFKYNDI